MRFTALALLVVAAATCCLAASVDELKNLADEAGAPFTQTALERLQNSRVWGAKRANRSSDVVIINGSKQPFKLQKSDCMQGHFTKDLLPENKLDGESSIVYGMESSKFLRGVQCTIEYESSVNEETWFNLMIHVPFYGDNAAYTFSSWDLKITPSVGAGNNSQVIFTVKDKFGFLSARSAQAGGLPSKKPKGNRNKFVKTSKSGSRSHKL